MARPSSRNFGCRISAREIDGLAAVVLENAAIRVGVLAGKGADVFEFFYKPREVDPLWRAPGGIVNPARVTPGEDGPFMDAYEGGWQELFPTLGAPAEFHGTALGEHGEVALLPWEASIERDDPDGVTVAFAVACRHSPFRLRRTLRLEGYASAVLHIDEEVVNAGERSLDFMWGHHPVVGPPFLAPGCALSLPGGQVHATELTPAGFRPSGTPSAWPRYRSPLGHEEDLRRLPEPAEAHVDELFVSDLPDGWYAVANPALGTGFGLRWELDVFPYLWLWRTLDRSYTLGLEPFSSVPPSYPAAVEAGTVHRLDAGASRSTSLTAVAFPSGGRVRSITPDGTVVLEGERVRP